MLSCLPFKRMRQVDIVQMLFTVKRIISLTGEIVYSIHHVVSEKKGLQLIIIILKLIVLFKLQHHQTQVIRHQNNYMSLPTHLSTPQLFSSYIPCVLITNQVERSSQYILSSLDQHHLPTYFNVKKATIQGCQFNQGHEQTLPELLQHCLIT